MLQITTTEQAAKVAAILNIDITECDGLEFPIKEIQLYEMSISFDQMAKIVDYLRQPIDCDKELFEKCWVAYKRKGNKKKSLDYWKKLSEKERSMVLFHINAYVQSRELKYMKDFERYLRDKVFLTVVYNGNQIIYDPTKTADNYQQEVYMPICGGALMYNDFFKCHVYVGAFNGVIPDGYTDDMRPNGARIMLNNGRGFVVWHKDEMQWKKQ